MSFYAAPDVIGDFSAGRFFIVCRSRRESQTPPVKDAIGDGMDFCPVRIIWRRRHPPRPFFLSAPPFSDDRVGRRCYPCRWLRAEYGEGMVVALYGRCVATVCHTLQKSAFHRVTHRLTCYKQRVQGALCFTWNIVVYLSFYPGFIGDMG